MPKIQINTLFWDFIADNSEPGNNKYQSYWFFDMKLRTVKETISPF